MVQSKKRTGQGREPYTFVISADQDLEGWLRERRNYLTATDIPSILGIPGARDPLETWYQKKDALMARAEDQQIREAKKAGHDFEDFNALMFAKAANRHVLRSQQLLHSNDHRWLAATLDYTQQRNITKPGVKNISLPDTVVSMREAEKLPLELKNAGSFAAADMWPVGGEPHLTWQLQLVAQLIVLDVDMGSLSAWLGSPFVHHRWCDIERNKGVEEIILEEGEQFWRSLKKNKPPEFAPNKATYEILRRLDPKRTTGQVISLPKAAVDVHARLWAAERQLEKSKERFDLDKAHVEHVRAEMAALIGENAGGTLPTGELYTFQHVHVPTHTVQAHSYRKLNRVSAKASKAKRTTWKTSK